MEFDTVLITLFHDGQRQVNTDETIYHHYLVKAARFFESGAELEYKELAKHKDRVEKLVRYCHPDIEIEECQTIEGFELYGNISKIHASAIGNFLKNCNGNKLEQCAPSLVGKIERDLVGLYPNIRYSIHVNLGYAGLTDIGRHWKPVARIMLDVSGKAVTKALSKWTNGKEMYEHEFDRVFESFCRPLIERLDPRAKFYGTLPFGNSRSETYSIVTWNSVAEHCKFILSNKKDIMNKSYKYLKAELGSKCF